MKAINLLGGYSHEVIHNKGAEGAPPDGTEAQCYGQPCDILSGSHEHIQHYSGNWQDEHANNCLGDMSAKGVPVADGSSIQIGGHPDQGVDNKSKGGSDPTPAMPGA